MLTLLEGGFGSICHEELINKIKASLAAGRRAFLIVPEQQTLSCESEMCELLPESAPLVFEVTNFTRFANTAFRTLGGIGGKYCTGAETSLIMWRVLTDLAPKLTMMRGRRTPQNGMVERVLAAIREMQSHGITPEALREVCSSGCVKDARLLSKLTDLALIFTLYRELVSENYNDLGEDAAMLAKKLGENPEFLTGCDIYIDGFISFTEPQYKLISVMTRHTAVCVTLTLPKSRRDAFEYSEVKATEDRLKGIARREECDVSVLRRDAPDYKYNQSLRELGELLFSTSGEIDNDCLQELASGGGRVKIYEANDPFEECDFVAADIKRRVMGGGSYGDIAIIARSADKYVGILDASLSRAGVPHFISKRRDIDSFEAIKLINTAYQIAARGFRREDVLTYAKCGLAGITREACDELELYVLRWSIDGCRFTDGVRWNMNPRGYTTPGERDEAILLSLDRTRRKIIEPLVRFAESVKASTTVREQASALMEFLGEIKLEKCLFARAKELFELGEIESAEENARLWQTICQSLDTLVDVLGDTKADAESFITLLGVVFKEASIARLPLSHDQVTVGSADTLRIRDKRHVYLIGANSGEFPSNVTDASYFTDRDKAALKALNLPIEPDLTVKNARELYCFIRAFLSGRDSATVLYTRVSAAMSPLLPSEVIERIGELTNKAILPVKIDTLPLGERIFSPHDAIMVSSELAPTEYNEVREALVEVGMADIVAVAERSPINSSLSLGKDALAVIYKGDVYMSQSRLDKFRSCPFSYYARYVLGLNDERVSELSPDVLGSFIHSVLENFFGEIYQNGRSVSDLTDGERDRLAITASRKYIDLVLGGGFGEARKENAIARLCRAARPIIDGLCEEFASSKYKPVFFELSTYGASEEAPDPVSFPLDGDTSVVISGYVDRVDKMKVGDDVYVRVVDYKSGSKKFDPRDLEKGENLQMFLYLKSIIDTSKPEFLKKMGVPEGGRLVPAGVIYVKTSLKDTVIDRVAEENEALRSLYTREGMLLDDEKNLEATTPDYMPEGGGKDGNARKYSAEGWDTLCKTVEEAVVGLVGRMRSGDASATPRVSGSSSPCSYCPYKPICRNPKVR